MKNKKSLIIGIAVLVLCLLCFVGLYSKFAPKAESGSKSYTLEVVENGNTSEFTGKTDAEFLSGLMDELKAEGSFTYEGTPSDYGMFITSVQGVEASDAEKTYWAIYVNDEYGQYGADAQPVSDGDKYTLQLESYE